MDKYQLLKPPEEGWRGRMSVIAHILRNVFRTPKCPAPELQPIVDRMDEIDPLDR